MSRHRPPALPEQIVYVGPSRTDWRPEEVPGLRRELVEHFAPDGPGVTYFRNCIIGGMQPLRPRHLALGPAAAWLAARERAAMSDAVLRYVDHDLCDLVEAAAPAMPLFAPHPSDLPGPSGFVVFARPIADLPPRDVDHVFDRLAHLDPRMGEDPVTRAVAHAAEGFGTQIIAASWGPVQALDLDRQAVGRWPAGGLWMSFYAGTRVQDGSAPITIDEELAFAWRPDGAPADRYKLPDVAGRAPGWTRLVFAAFILSKQQDVTASDTLRTGRPERRRTARAGLPERDVVVVRLRVRPPAAGAPRPAGTGRGPLTERVPVGGYWRNQWYPTLDDHRPKWVKGHFRGPKDAPIRSYDRVTILDARRHADDTTPADIPKH